MAENKNGKVFYINTFELKTVIMICSESKRFYGSILSLLVALSFCFIFTLVKLITSCDFVYHLWSQCRAIELSFLLKYVIYIVLLHFTFKVIEFFNAFIKCTLIVHTYTAYATNV